MKKHKIAALIMAAGRGERLSGVTPKQYLELGGVSVLRRTIEAFISNDNVDMVRVVINPDDVVHYKRATEGLSLVCPVHGGKTRQESVRLGLESLEELQPDHILIHDAARPFVTDEVINCVTKELKNKSAVIPVIPVNDTVKRLNKGNIKETVNRENLSYAQTPQGFHYKDILEAHKKNKGDFLDDSGLAEEAGMGVGTVAGDTNNFKITTEEDLIRAEKYIQANYETRTGMGYDVHAFEDKEGDLVICGVSIPYERTLKGHSDGDVGLHAVVDSLLGAMGEGDIGYHFSDKDKKWKDADSTIFTSHALNLIKDKKGEIIHIDLTIICEQPKIGPHREDMKKRVAEILEISDSRVSIKATTTEGLGFLGRGEGIAAQAISTIKLQK